jgi:hypothetical protein
MNRTPILVLHAAAAAIVSLASGWAGSGIVICVVAPGFLVRYVWLDDERLMVGAMFFTALLAMMANTQHGLSGTVTVSLGGFLAAEIAAHGARVRRAAPLSRVPGDVIATAGVVVGAFAVTLATALAVQVGVPVTVSVAAAALLAVVVLVATARRQPNAVEDLE